MTRAQESNVNISSHPQLAVSDSTPTVLQHPGISGLIKAASAALHLATHAQTHTHMLLRDNEIVQTRTHSHARTHTYTQSIRQRAEGGGVNTLRLSPCQLAALSWFSNQAEKHLAAEM